MTSFKEHWAEYFSVLFLLIAFIVLLFTPNSTSAFFIIFIGGIAGGRICHEAKYKGMFPHILITLGPWIGFILGSRFFGWKIVTLIFFTSYYASYKVHTLGIVP